MKCTELQRKISSFIDGELEKDSADALRTHLLQCEDCRTWYERLLALDRNLTASSLFHPDAALTQRVKEKISSRASAGTDRSIRYLWWRAAAVAAAIVLAVGVGNFAGQSLSKMFVPEFAEHKLDFLIPENGPFLVDAVLEIGHQEDSR